MSRIEFEPEPASVPQLFPEQAQLDRIRRFTAALATHSEELGLLGPLELPRIWTRHVLNSAIVRGVVRGPRVADVGSGSGLPGLVLAIARPDVHFTLIEPMERRVVWLESQVQNLNLDNVAVLRSRAEEVDDIGTFDQVTARAVSALRTLIPITTPLLRPGGQLILMKGARIHDEMTAAAKVIRSAQLTDVHAVELGSGVLDETTWVFTATHP